MVDIIKTADFGEDGSLAQLLIDTSPAFIVVIDSDFRVKMMNRAMLNALEYSAEEVEGVDYMSLAVPDGRRQDVLDIVNDYFDGHIHESLESPIISRSGRVYMVEWHGQVIPGRAEGKDILISIGIDITGRKNTERELFEKNEELTAMYEEMEAANEELMVANRELQIAEERYRGVVDTQSEMIARYTEEGIITFANKSWLDYHREHMGLKGNPLGKRLDELVKDGVLKDTVDFIESSASEDDSAFFEYSITSLSGGTRWQQWYVRKISDEENRYTEYQAVGNDITERRNAETALRTSEENLRLLIEMAPDAIFIGDSTGTITGANRKASELTGFEHDGLLGKNIKILFAEEELKKVPLRYDLLKEGHVVSSERAIRHRNGNDIPVGMNTVMMPDGRLAAFVRDMTEQRRIEDVLQKAEKISFLEILAGGIAHDFNNLLSGIFGYIEMARLNSSKEDAVLKYLDKAHGVFDRARDLTQQLLLFSRGGSPVRETGNLATVLVNSASFIITGSNILCRYEIDDGLDLCDFDKNQMGQVIDNLIINAKQAMPDGGTITISASNIYLEEKENPILKPGRYVKISVADTGAGISAENMDRIFEPFFSTKSEGSGLGLATCYSIIKKHDGHIDVESEEGKGTTFNILLPVSKEKTEISKSLKASEHAGTGNVLIMDDEDFIREIAGEMLSQMGYSVIKAGDGEEALKLCREFSEAGNPVIAAILDLTIPGGRSGRDVIDEMRKVCPHMPVFASSGFSEDEIMLHPVDSGFTDSISKPYRKEELAEIFRKHL